MLPQSPLGSVYGYTYQYDGAGNRKATANWEQKAGQSSLSLVEQSTYNVDTANRLTSQLTYRTVPTSTIPLTTTSIYTYDNASNLVAQVTREVSGTTALTKTDELAYVYDARNRLSQLGVLSGTQLVYANRFTYDGANTRLASEQLYYPLVGGGSPTAYTTGYLQDVAGGLPVVLRENTGASSARHYLYTPGSTAPIRELVVEGVSQAVYYNHLDGLGSVRVRTDRDGFALDPFMYREPFGTESRASATDSSSNQHQASSSSGQGSSRYAGEQREAVSGLYYNRARYYDPKTGRFTQQDTYAGQASDQNSVNRFAYAHNSPTNLTDPSGNCPVCLGALVGGGISYLMQVGFNALQGRKNPWSDNISWAAIGAGIASGGIGGIAFNAVNATWKTFALAGALNGVAGGRVGRVAENVFSGKAPLDNFIEWGIAGDAVLGGAFGAVGFGLGQVFNPNNLTKYHTVREPLSVQAGTWYDGIEVYPIRPNHRNDISIWENAIIGEEVEHALIIREVDGTHELIAAARGIRGQARFSHTPDSVRENAILTHNHPPSTIRTLSGGDLSFAIRYNLKEIRAVTIENGQRVRYVARRSGDTWNPALLEYFDGSTERQRQFYLIWFEIEDLLPHLRGLDNELAHTAHEIFASRYGYTYYREIF